MVIGVETAIVYKAGGVRYLTKRAAYVAAARAKIKTRCECVKAYRDEPMYAGETCYYHEMENYQRIIKRLVRWYKFIDNKKRKNI